MEDQRIYVNLNKINAFIQPVGGEETGFGRFGGEGKKKIV
jgi:hypothetical protein